ncbi:hypothetical protein L7F22_055029 [Adiantum nelumboides]|nr:hypothetical protein [Adiantum nelumboides]
MSKVDAIFCCVGAGVCWLGLLHTDEICAAIRDVFEGEKRSVWGTATNADLAPPDTRSIPEPAGALAVAGMKRYIIENNLQESGKRFIATVSGANMNFSRLRFVAERSELGQKSEVLLMVEIPESPGSFLELIRKIFLGPFSEFSYRYGDKSKAQIFLSFMLDTVRESELNRLLESINSDGRKAIDISQNEMAKSHARYMVGGKGCVPTNDCSSSPSRATWLVAQISPRLNKGWNISLFNYRNRGGDTANVLVGIQVEPVTTPTSSAAWIILQYQYSEETHNEAYLRFIK